MRKSTMVISEDTLSAKISYISFICIFLVVLIHNNNIELYGLNHTNGVFVFYFEKFISQNISLMAVPMFFTMSGYLFYRNFKLDKLKSKLKSRIKSLFIPFVSWNLIYYIFYFLLTNIPSLTSIITEDKVELSFLNLIQAIFLYKYNYVFWFLGQLIIFVLLCPVIYRVIEKKYVGMVILVFLLGVILFKIEISFIKLDSLLFYIIGAYIGIHSKDIVYLVKEKRYLNSMGYFLCAEFIFLLSNQFEILEGFKVVFKILLIISIWLLVSPNTTKVSWLYSCSFFIYCAHPYILETLKKIIYLFMEKTVVFALLNYIISPLATVVIILMIYKVMERFMHKILIILTGSR